MTVPTRRDRFRPLELISLSAVIAVFVAGIVFMSTRSLEPALVFGGLGFIVTLVVLAMLALTTAPSSAEQLDLANQNRADQTRADQTRPLGDTDDDGSVSGHG